MVTFKTYFHIHLFMRISWPDTICFYLKNKYFFYKTTILWVVHMECENGIQILNVLWGLNTKANCWHERVYNQPLNKHINSTFHSKSSLSDGNHQVSHNSFTALNISVGWTIKICHSLPCFILSHGIRYSLNRKASVKRSTEMLKTKNVIKAARTLPKRITSQSLPPYRHSHFSPFHSLIACYSANPRAYKETNTSASIAAVNSACIFSFKVTALQTQISRRRRRKVYNCTDNGYSMWRSYSESNSVMH